MGAGDSIAPGAALPKCVGRWRTPWLPDGFLAAACFGRAEASRVPSDSSIASAGGRSPANVCCGLGGFVL